MDFLISRIFILKKKQKQTKTNHKTNPEVPGTQGWVWGPVSLSGRGSGQTEKLPVPGSGAVFTANLNPTSTSLVLFRWEVWHQHLLSGAQTRATSPSNWFPWPRFVYLMTWISPPALATLKIPCITAWKWKCPVSGNFLKKNQNTLQRSTSKTLLTLWLGKRP